MRVCVCVCVYVCVCNAITWKMMLWSVQDGGHVKGWSVEENVQGLKKEWRNSVCGPNVRL